MIRAGQCIVSLMNNTRPALVALPSAQDPIEQAYLNLFREITRGIEPNFVRNARPTLRIV